jgi:hypothetical protein
MSFVGGKLDLKGDKGVKKKKKKEKKADVGAAGANTSGSAGTAAGDEAVLPPPTSKCAVAAALICISAVHVRAYADPACICGRIVLTPK